MTLPAFLKQTLALAAVFFLALTAAVAAVAGLVSLWGLPFGVLYAAFAVRSAAYINERTFG